MTLLVTVSSPSNFQAHEGETVTIVVTITGIDGTGVRYYDVSTMGVSGTARSFYPDLTYPSDFVMHNTGVVGGYVDPAGYGLTYEIQVEALGDDIYETPESMYVIVGVGGDATFGNGLTQQQFEITIFNFFPGIVGEGTTGDDLFQGRAGDDSFVGRSGNDVMEGMQGADRLLGDEGDDRIWGGIGDDDLQGGEGADQIWGGEDMDLMSGGVGDDRLFGDQGDDRLSGGADDDDLQGGIGADYLSGGSGRDRLDGGNDDDVIEAGRGDDSAKGGRGGDVVIGGKDNDKVQGGAGDDQLAGGTGHDLLDGGEGDDLLFGGEGDDKLFGGDNQDWLIGKEGSDRLTGGADSDRFDFSGGRTVIVDFEDNRDIIGLDHRIVPSWVEDWDDVSSFARVVNGNVVFDFGHGDVLTILGVRNIDILANDMGSF